MLLGRRFWFAISLAVLSFAAFAGEGGGLDYNLVQISADAQADVPNDQLEVLLSVEHESRDAAALPPLVNADMRWALDLARKRNAVKSETREYTTQPQYASGRIVGWRAQQQLYLESTDFGELTALVTALQEKLQVKSMRFLPRRETRLEVENALTRKALQAFAAKASLVADTMGAAGYEVVEISVNGQPQPYPVRARNMEVMAMAAADAPTPVAVEGGSATLTVSVSGRIQLR